MTLECPRCGSTSFTQDRVTQYDEVWEIEFDDQGNVDDESLVDQSASDAYGCTPYTCTECDWEAVDEKGEAVVDSDELVNLIERVRRNADPPRHIRECFLTLVIAEVLAVEVEGSERDMAWFVERLADCQSVLPVECRDTLGLDRGATYADAIKTLTGGSDE